MKKTILYVLCLLCSMTIHAQYHGIVYIDENGNGTFDSTEKLLKGVSVSDGLNVVKTNANGEYTLSCHEKAKFIFITTPSHYKPVDKFYQRISPSTKAFNFGLTSYPSGIKKDGSHNFIHFSDTEIREEEGHDEWLSQIRDYATNEEVAFIIHTGDICYEGGLNSHIKLMNSKNMNTQVFYTIGNHDLVKGKYGEELYEKRYGPVFYSFNAGNVHYIVTPMLHGDYAPSYTKEDVYKWLKNDLAQIKENTPIMVFSHDLLTQKDDFIYGINKKEYIDLDEHNLKAWFYGHWHNNHIKKHKSAYSICTSSVICGGIDHSTSAFRVIHVDKRGDFTSKMKYLYADKTLEIASIDNEHSPILESGKLPLSVNAYSTISEIKSIDFTYYVDGVPSGKRKSLKRQTDFNWYTEYRLPQNLLGKFITIEVTANCFDGEVFMKNKSFYYTKHSPQINAQNNWCNLLGNAQHNGDSKANIKAPLRLKWVKNIGSNIFFTSPVIYNEALFIASTDENDCDKACLSSFDIYTGNRNWNFKLEGSVKNTIVADGGLIFALDVYGNLYAVNSSTGKLKWKKQLNTPLLPPLIDGLVVEKGILYAGTGKHLYALQASTGETIWQNMDWNQNQGTTSTMSVGNGVLICHTQWGALYANDILSGKKLWAQTKCGLRHRSSSANMQDGYLYITSEHSLFIIATRTGEIISRKELGYNLSVNSTPLVTASEIVFGTADHGLVALDKETLEPKWNFKTGKALFHTSPYVRGYANTIESNVVLANDIVYFGASDGTFYGVKRTDGKIAFKHDFGCPVFSSAALSGNALFVADYSGNVYAFVGDEKE